MGTCQSVLGSERFTNHPFDKIDRLGELENELDELSNEVTMPPPTASSMSRRMRYEDRIEEHDRNILTLLSSSVRYQFEDDIFIILVDEMRQVLDGLQISYPEHTAELQERKQEIIDLFGITPDIEKKMQERLRLY